MGDPAETLPEPEERPGLELVVDNTPEGQPDQDPAKVRRWMSVRFHCTVGIGESPTHFFRDRKAEERD